MSAFQKSTISNIQSEAAAAISSGDPAKALALYRSAARLDPKNPMHSLRAGDCLVRLGRINEALPVYRQVAERFAEDGQHARAVSVYRLVQRLAPQDLAVTRRLTEINALRGKPEAPKSTDVTAVTVAAMFPEIDLDAAASEPEPVRVPPELCSLWDEEAAAAAAQSATHTAALEATVRNLMSALLRIQSELDALKARHASAEAVVTVC